MRRNRSRYQGATQRDILILDRALAKQEANTTAYEIDINKDFEEILLFEKDLEEQYRKLSATNSTENSPKKDQLKQDEILAIALEQKARDFANFSSTDDEYDKYDKADDKDYHYQHPLSN